MRDAWETANREDEEDWVERVDSETKRIHKRSPAVSPVRDASSTGSGMDLSKVPTNVLLAEIRKRCTH